MTSIACQTYAQTEVSGKHNKDKTLLVQDAKSIDTTLHVIVSDKKDNAKRPLFIIDDIIFKNVVYLKDDQIQSMDVNKGETIIDGDTFYGEIRINTKPGYSPKFITLNELKSKYTDLEKTPVVYTIDGILLNKNENEVYIDENNILTITIDKLNTSDQNAEIGIINVLTKSKKNIDKRNGMRLRGSESI